MELALTMVFFVCIVSIADDVSSNDQMRKIQENFHNCFYSVARNDHQGGDVNCMVLQQKALQERQAFNSIKSELHLAQHKKNYIREEKFRSRRENPSKNAEASTISSINNPPDNVGDLREILRNEKNPRSHAYNAGLNAAAAQLLPVISSLRNNLVSTYMEYLTCAETIIVNDAVNDAEFLEFILHVRVRAGDAENFYLNLKGINVENDQVYKQCLKKIFNETDPPELLGNKGVHFRKWIVTLHEGYETISSSLRYLRQSLDYDREQYFKFATGMQQIYGIFSKPQYYTDVLKPRYFNASDPEKYIRLLNADCKFSVRKFLKSEMAGEELGNESEDEGTSEV